MRLAWFTHRYYTFRGGSENFARAMVRRFVGAGDSVDVWTSDAHDLWYFTSARFKRIDAPAREWVDGARVTRCPVRHLPAQRYLGRLLHSLPHWPTRCRFESYMPFIPGLGRVRGEYDAVCAIGFPYTLFAYSALQTARAAKAPLILVPFLHLATPGDAHHRHNSRPHQRRLLRAADCVVVQTDIEADAVSSWDIPRERLLKLGMAVEREEVTGGCRFALRSRLGIDPMAFVVGQLGANDANKGTVDLVHAVDRINTTRNENQWMHLILAGAASPAFESFVAGFQRAPWLHRLGEIGDDSRRDFYAALDVFAMPSRTDSFGIVFLEAWANGLPVVAAAAGGVTEVVAHEERGLLVPFGDMNAIARALERLQVDAGLRLQLGAAGRAHVASAGFTWDSRFEVLRAKVLEMARGGAATMRMPPRRPFLERSARSRVNAKA